MHNLCQEASGNPGAVQFAIAPRLTELFWYLQKVVPSVNAVSSVYRTALASLMLMMGTFSIQAVGNMKHLYQAAVATLLSSIATSSAFAADGFAPSEFVWSGIAVGVVGSYSTGKDLWKDGDYPLEGAGFIGGFVGYDHQFGSFVLGARATGQLGGMEEEDDPDFEYQAFYDFNGRAGFAMDRALVYATTQFLVFKKTGNPILGVGITLGAAWNTL